MTRVRQDKWTIGIAAILTCVMMISNAVATIGISTRFVDVVLEYLEVGRSYNLRLLKAMPYSVKNRSTIPVEIGVEVLIPAKTDLMRDYEAIPDPSWIKIIPNKLRVEPGAMGYAELIVQVPNEQDNIGKHYQAKIRATTLNTGLFATAAESRLRFSTGAGPEALKEEEKRLAMLTLDFDITPTDLFIDGVEPGKPFNVKKNKKRTMKVTNRAENPMNMKFTSVKWDFTRFPVIQGGYEPAPDPSWIKFVPEEKEIGADTIESLEPIIEIPDEEIHYGKSYAFMIKADIIMGTDLEVYNKIFVNVIKKGGTKR